jgi:hypothetical protein
MVMSLYNIWLTLLYWVLDYIREHYQWNMDIWGVPGVEAEAEVLSALVSSLQAMGLTSQEVGIKVSVYRYDYCITLSCKGFETVCGSYVYQLNLTRLYSTLNTRSILRT